MPNTVASILESKGRMVRSIGPELTVFEAIGEMVTHNVGSLLVLDGGAIVGIITERDYLRKIALEGRSSRTTRVREVMTPRVVVVDIGEDVESCMAVMTAQRIRHLPVLENGALAGIVSLGDLVKHISKAREAEVHYLQDYITGRYPA